MASSARAAVNDVYVQNRLPLKVDISRLFHVQQSSSWDCGIACLKMVLSDETRQTFSEIYNSLEQLMGFGECVWTIDLSHMLHRLGIEHRYYTVTLGVDPTYENKLFYKHEDFVLDKQRVERQFQLAKELGIFIEKRSVDIHEVIEHLANGHPIIVLTNHSFLKCSCWNHLTNCFCSSCRTTDYTGHYVVLCGYDLEQQQIFFRNPTYSDSICKCSFEDMDAARKSHGTDEDMIFIME